MDCYDTKGCNGGACDICNLIEHIDPTKLKGEIRLEYSAKNNEYYAYDENGFICGTIGVNKEKFEELIKRSNEYEKSKDKAPIDLEDFADYLIDYATAAFDHQDRKLLLEVLQKYFKE